MRYKFGNKTYEGHITVQELFDDLQKNKECIMVLDMKKTKIKDVTELNAQGMIDSIKTRRIVYK